MPRVAKRIDDVVYENYEIHRASNKRTLKPNVYSNLLCEDGSYYHPESDYVDAREVYTYDASHLVLQKDLSEDNVKRLATICELFERVLNKQSVRYTDIQKALTGNEYTAYVESLESMWHQNEIKYKDGMPAQLKKYNIMLNKADLMFNKYESLSSNKKNKSGTVYDKAEVLYENALSYLEETFSCAERGDWGGEVHNQLYTWMDRDVVFGINGNVSIDRDGVPRVRGSKSQCALDAELPKLSKRLKREECLLCALIVACCDIAFVLPTAPQPVYNIVEKLRNVESLMKTINSEKD